MGQLEVRERQRPYPAMPPPDDECRCWRGSCWNDTLGRADMAPAVELIRRCRRGDHWSAREAVMCEHRVRSARVF